MSLERVLLKAKNISDLFLYKIDQSILGDFYLSKFGNNLGIRINHQYRQYAAYCRNKYIADGNASIDYQNSVLRNKHPLLIKNVLTPDYADSISQLMDKEIKNNGNNIFKKTNISAQIKKPQESVLEKDFFDIVFGNSEVNKSILSYFGSYYKIVWADLYRSFPSEEHKSSWLWHIDNAPIEMLKIMIHFTDAGKLRGGTLFINKDQTSGFLKNGYAGFGNNRLRDLSEFAQKHNLGYSPMGFDSKKGDVVIFNHNLLHKGEPPSMLHRDVSTIVLMPSDKPWHINFDPHNLMNPFEEGSYFLNPFEMRGNPLHSHYFFKHFKNEMKWFIKNKLKILS